MERGRPVGAGQRQLFEVLAAEGLEARAAPRRQGAAEGPDEGVNEGRVDAARLGLTEDRRTLEARVGKDALRRGGAGGARDRRAEAREPRKGMKGYAILWCRLTDRPLDCWAVRLSSSPFQSPKKLVVRNTEQRPHKSTVAARWKWCNHV